MKGQKPTIKTHRAGGAAQPDGSAQDKHELAVAASRFAKKKFSVDATRRINESSSKQFDIVNQNKLQPYREHQGLAEMRSSSLGKQLSSNPGLQSQHLHPLQMSKKNIVLNQNSNEQIKTQDAFYPHKKRISPTVTIESAVTIPESLKVGQRSEFLQKQIELVYKCSDRESSKQLHESVLQTRKAGY